MVNFYHMHKVVKMRRNKIREIRVEAGDYMRISHVSIRRTAHGKRGHRYAPTSDAQKKINERNAEYRLQEILQLNFGRGTGAMVIGFDYDNAHLPQTCEEGIAIFQKYIKRLNYRLKRKAAEPAKYIYVTSYGKQSGRVHHHCVMIADFTVSELRELWGNGRVHGEGVYYDETGMLGLADYLARQGVSRKWNSSKGLIRPEPIKRDDRISLRDARYISNGAGSIDTHWFIEKLYPGWKVHKVIPAAEPEEGGGLPGIYTTILLYREGMRIGYDDIKTG